jgi:hypothetical protein
MATILIIGGGGEQDYREGQHPLAGKAAPDRNLRDDELEGAGVEREDERSDKLERRHNSPFSLQRVLSRGMRR